MALNIVYLPIGELTPYLKNPRKNDKAVDIVARSIKEYGFLVPIILDKDKIIVAGHTRLKAAQKLGLSEVPTICAENLTEEQIKGFRIMDNKANEYADWDIDILTKELGELKALNFDLELTGFKETELNKLMPDNLEEKELPDPQVPKYEVKLGEVYQLGNHRLMCADSTNKENQTILLNGQQIDMVFTDPPYGIDIVNSSNVGITARTGFGKVGTTGVVPAREYRKIEGDDKPFDPTFLLNLAPKIILWGANNYASKLKDNAQWLVWDKKCEQGADHNNFSDCELAYTNVNAKSVRIYRHLWSGLLREGNRDVELSKRVHPTQKPVGLNCEIIKDYSKDNELILDLFGGSGSTLIACEQTNRKCYMMELDPKYCSVIIERWENLTNQKAVKL